MSGPSGEIRVTLFLSFEFITLVPKESPLREAEAKEPPPTTPGGGSSVSVGNTLNQEGRSDWFIIKLRNTGIQCFISYSKDRGAKSKKSSPYPEFIPLS